MKARKIGTFEKFLAFHLIRDRRDIRKNWPRIPSHSHAQIRCHRQAHIPSHINAHIRSHIDANIRSHILHALEVQWGVFVPEGGSCVQDPLGSEVLADTPLPK